MRDGWLLEDLCREFSWTDLAAYVRYSRPDSALKFVQDNPPIDPDSVSQKTELETLSARMRAARRSIAERGVKGLVRKHGRKKEKQLQ